MRRSFLRGWLVGLAVLAVGLLIAGLLVLRSTAKPIHRSAQDVPSRTDSTPSPPWADAVERGRQILLQTSQRLTSGQETGYGLGWTLETHPLARQPTRMAGHGSKEESIGDTTYLMTFPERGLVIAVTANISYADTKSVALNIAQAFAEQGRNPARQ